MWRMWATAQERGSAPPAAFLVQSRRPREGAACSAKRCSVPVADNCLGTPAPIPHWSHDVPRAQARVLDAVDIVATSSPSSASVAAPARTVTAAVRGLSACLNLDSNKILNHLQPAPPPYFGKLAAYHRTPTPCYPPTERDRSSNSLGKNTPEQKPETTEMQQKNVGGNGRWDCMEGG